MSSIHRDLMEHFISIADELGLPRQIALDFLPSRQDALSIQPDANPKTEKAYIGGSKVCLFPFTVLATTSGAKSSAPSLKAIDWLNSIGSHFEGMSNYRLSDNRTILNGETMTPALLARNADGQLVYSMSISIRYEENK